MARRMNGLLRETLDEISGNQGSNSSSTCNWPGKGEDIPKRHLDVPMWLSDYSKGRSQHIEISSGIHTGKQLNPAVSYRKNMRNPKKFHVFLTTCQTPRQARLVKITMDQ